MVFIVGGADPNRSFSDVHTIDLGKTSSGGDFPGSPVVGTPSFHCSEDVFHPWLGNKDTMPCGMVKKKQPEAAEHVPFAQRAGLCAAGCDHS